MDGRTLITSHDHGRGLISVPLVFYPPADGLGLKISSHTSTYISDTCVNLTRRSRCNSSSRCCYRARGHVDPTSSRNIRCDGDSHPETPSSPGSVGLARVHPLTQTQAMEPSCRARSSYGPPYPFGRWYLWYSFPTRLHAKVCTSYSILRLRGRAWILSSKTFRGSGQT